MKRPTLGQIMAGLLIFERVHSTICDFVPSYAEYADNLVNRLRRKLGLTQTLYDKIVSFLGTDNMMEGFVRTDHSILDGPMWIFLNKHCTVNKVIQLKNLSEPVQLYRSSDLEFVEVSNFYECDTETIKLRKFEDRPSCVEKIEDNGEGISPFLITMMYYHDRPFVIQIRNSESEGEDESTIVDFLFNSEDRDLFQQLSRKLKKYISEHSPLKGWVVSCEVDDFGNLMFHFDQELCEQLRHKKYEFDIDLYSEDVKNLMQKDIANFIIKQESFCDRGYDGRRAYLLEGPPGTGKSDIIKSIISTLPKKYTIILLNERNIDELRVLKRMKFLFPALIVVEDIDLLVTSKSKWQILLNFLDGFHAPDRIMTVMTSNNKEGLISSITNRPGRIDRIIHIGPGSESQRIAQLESLTHQIRMPEDVSLLALAKKTDGYTVAQLRELIRRSMIYTDGTNDSISTESITTVLQEFDRQKMVEEKINMNIIEED